MIAIFLSTWLLNFSLWLNPKLLNKIEDASWVEGCNYNTELFENSQNPEIQKLEYLQKRNCIIGEALRALGRFSLDINNGKDSNR